MSTYSDIFNLDSKFGKLGASQQLNPACASGDFGSCNSEPTSYGSYLWLTLPYLLIQLIQGHNSNCVY